MNSQSFTNRVFDRVLGESRHSVETRSQPGVRPGGKITMPTAQSDAVVQGLNRIASLTTKGEKKVRGILDPAIEKIRARRKAL